jgi:peptidoglycan hydrolase-like protein with peptidoglycan-binding domain
MEIASKYKIDMRIKIASVLLLFVALVSARADDMIAGVQQSLKDQGFYYGEITGAKDADTIAAVRRYQIRNGLQVSGDLNEETMRSLKSAGTTPLPSTPAPPAPVATPRAPSPPPDTSELRDEPVRGEVVKPRPGQPSDAPLQDRQSPPVYQGGAVPIQPDFVGTPFENAPPEVQRKVIIDAQNILAQRELYRGPLDGIFGPELEFSLRAYQARVGLKKTGRLDLQTLAALELLPGANAPVYTPRRRVLRRPPVRGEWIRP